MMSGAAASPGALLLTEGRFGLAVAERIARSLEGATVLPLRRSLHALEALVSQAGFVGVAAWRPYPSAADAVDAACARHGVPWSSVTMDGRFLVMGPLVVPGRGPCHACYRKRRSTHSAHGDRDRVLDTLYEAHPDVGCEGFLPGSVAVAAAALALDSEEAGTAPGRVRRLDVLRLVTEETRVVRVHGCDRCGHSHVPGERYVLHLRAALDKDAP